MNRSPRPNRGATGVNLALSSFTLAVRDLDEALAFYRDVLGFDVRRDDSAAETARRVSIGPPSQPGVRIVLRTPAADPHVSPADRRSIEDLTAKGLIGHRLVFQTDNCDATFEYVESAGAEVMQEPINHPDGVRDCVFFDPSGNILCFTQATQATQTNQAPAEPGTRPVTMPDKM